MIHDKTTEELLAKRGERYGDYFEVACLSQTLKNVMRNSLRWRDLSPAHQESLDMVANKLARMLCGDPTYLDNIDDIIGYMTLLRRELVKT